MDTRRYTKEILQEIRARSTEGRRFRIGADQSGRKEIDMGDKRTWGKWDGPQPPQGDGGLGSGSPPSGGSEAEGHSRQFVATCFKCGTQSYIGGDWKWFTCWKCGAMSTETAMA